MKLDVIKEKDIPLLKRKRVTMMYNSSEKTTPKRSVVVKDVAKKLGASKDAVSIRHIYPQFGTSSSKIIVHVYKDKKTMEMFEDKQLLDKHVDKPKEEKEEAKPVPAPEGEGGEEQSSEAASTEKPKPQEEEDPVEEKPAQEEPKEESQDKKVEEK